MSENEKPKKPLATEVLATANPHLQPGELQKVWHPKAEKPKK
jgi:hypothetical protein